MRSEEVEQKLKLLSKYLSPERPIRNLEFLRGRDAEFTRLSDELSIYNSIPFIFGNRGVGKTSLARTAAQMVTAADREHVYAACAPASTILSTLRFIAQELIDIVIATKGVPSKKRKEYTFSLKPSIKVTYDENYPVLAPFNDINDAVRALKNIDNELSNSKKTVVIIDELEEASDEDRVNLAYLIKQLGDQEFDLRFMLVGIADNVHDLIGTHASVHRYIHEVSLSPLPLQALIDVIKDASDALDISVPDSVLYRIAIIGNGYPHFAHLIGKSLLHETICSEMTIVDPTMYKSAITRSVNQSIEVLTDTYNTAVQRQDDVYKYLIWALADSDVVDVRNDNLFERCRKIGEKQGWIVPDDAVLSKRLQRLRTDSYGKIIMNTPKQSGSTEIIYRHNRFSNSLMRGHVRLVAESEGVQLGKEVTL